jgi:subtilisin family serine protease
VGPFQVDRGHTSYFFLGGTSMASPHVAGIVAMMAQANPGLTPAQAEAILESTAVPVAPGTATVLLPSGGTQDVTWGADATGSGLVSAPAAIAAAGP